MTSSDQNKLLSSLPENKLLTAKAESIAVESAIQTTSGKVAELVELQEEDIEAKRDSLMEKLDSLGDELDPALQEYHSLFTESYGNIDAQNINIEYASDEVLKPLNISNIESSALFSEFNPNDIEGVILYNNLLLRLKGQKDTTIQAHLLGFMDLLSTYVISRKANQKNLDGGDVIIQDMDKYAKIKGVEKDELPTNEKMEGDGFKKIVFGNPNINPSYKVLLKRVFDLMDKDPELMIDVSNKLHAKHGEVLPHDIKSMAQSTAKIFE